MNKRPRQLHLPHSPLYRLYLNAGKKLGLKKVLTHFYLKLSQDVIVGFFFYGRDLDQIIANQLAFLLTTMRVKSHYQGRSPKNAHKGLPPILSGHFDRRIIILEQTLKEYEFDPGDIKTWLEFEKSFRDQIVQS